MSGKGGTRGGWQEAIDGGRRNGPFGSASAPPADATVFKRMQRIERNVRPFMTAQDARGLTEVRDNVAQKCGVDFRDHRQLHFTKFGR